MMTTPSKRFRFTAATACGGLAALALAIVSPLATAQQAPPPAAAAPPAETTPAARQLGPAEVARELADMLSRDRLPWSFYGRYTTSFRGFSATIRDALAKRDHTMNDAAKTRGEAMIAFYDEVAKTLTEMAEHKRHVDEIRNNTSTVRGPQRRDLYRQAMLRHETLRTELLTKLAAFEKAPGAVQRLPGAADSATPAATR